VASDPQRELREIVGVSAKVKLVAPESLPTQNGKGQKVIDRRKK